MGKQCLHAGVVPEWASQIGCTKRPSVRKIYDMSNWLVLYVVDIFKAQAFVCSLQPPVFGRSLSSGAGTGQIMLKFEPF